MAVERNTSTRVTIGGIEYVYFGGTNYLSLSHRPELIRAADDAFEELGFSAGASRLTSGESTNLLLLEVELATWANSEKALILPAGFMSNMAVVDAIDHVVDGYAVQTNAHGSIKSAIRVSRKPCYPYTDIAELREITNQNKKICIFAEPINSLTGGVADLPPVYRFLNSGHFVVFDEAHSLGVLGRTGFGALEHFHMSPHPNLIRTGTLSKAVGTYGGFVMASAEFIAAIKAHSEAYKSSTALPPVVVAATRRSLRFILNEAESPVANLRRNIGIMNSALVGMGFQRFAEHSTPIYYLDHVRDINGLRKRLQQERLYTPTIGYYFGNAEPGGFRWTIQAGHSQNDLEKLVSVLEAHLQLVRDA